MAAAPKPRQNQPRPVPMPIDLVLTHKPMFGCSGPVYRAVVLITCHLWASGNVQMPADSATLCHLAKIPQPHWKPLEIATRAILAELLPKLAQAHAVTVARRANLQQILSRSGNYGGLALRAKRDKAADLDATQNNPPIPQKPTTSYRPAQTARRYASTQSHISPQGLAAIPDPHLADAAADSAEVIQRQQVAQAIRVARLFDV